jgi:DNA-binding MarR family transcriptional regulator
MARVPKAVDVHPLLIAFKTFVILSVGATEDGDRDLSQRQIGVFLAVATEDETEHTVRGLAQRLNISKPAITRAIDRLEEFELVKRNVDPADKRSVIITRRSEGTAFLKRMSKLAGESDVGFTPRGPISTR